MRLWRRNAILNSVLISLISLALGAASFLLLRQLNARIVTERALLQRDEELIEAQRIAGIGSARFELPHLTAHLSSRLGSLLGIKIEKDEITLDELMTYIEDDDRQRLRAAIESCTKSGGR